MKNVRIGCVMTILLLFCSISSVISETAEIRFQIQADSKTHQEAELKTQIADIYSQLTEGVDEQSRSVIIAQSLNEFEVLPEVKAEYSNNTLIVIQGDGRGSLISGSFDAFSCGRPVHPKSWIAEVLGY